MSALCRYDLPQRKYKRRRIRYTICLGNFMSLLQLWFFSWKILTEVLILDQEYFKVMFIVFRLLFVTFYKKNGNLVLCSIVSNLKLNFDQTTRNQFTNFFACINLLYLKSWPNSNFSNCSPDSFRIFQPSMQPHSLQRFLKSDQWKKYPCKNLNWETCLKPYKAPGIYLPFYIGSGLW